LDLFLLCADESIHINKHADLFKQCSRLLVCLGYQFLPVCFVLIPHTKEKLYKSSFLSILVLIKHTNSLLSGHTNTGSWLTAILCHQGYKDSPCISSARKNPALPTVI